MSPGQNYILSKDLGQHLSSFHEDKGREGEVHSLQGSVIIQPYNKSISMRDFGFLVWSTLKKTDIRIH